MTVDRSTRGRRRRRQESANPVPTIAQHPFQQLRRPYPPVPIISDDQVEHIHQAYLKLLSETGLTLCVEALVGEVGGDHMVKLEDQGVVTEDRFETMSVYPLDERLFPKG